MTIKSMSRLAKLALSCKSSETAKILLNMNWVAFLILSRNQLAQFSIDFGKFAFVILQAAEQMT
jgi:hypothetical protein